MKTTTAFAAAALAIAPFTVLTAGGHAATRVTTKWRRCRPTPELPATSIANR